MPGGFNPDLWLTIPCDTIFLRLVVFLRSISVVRLPEFALESEFCRLTSQQGHTSRSVQRESSLSEYPFRLPGGSRLDIWPISRQLLHKDGSPHSPIASACETVFRESMAATTERSWTVESRASAIRMRTYLTRSKSTSTDWCTRMPEVRASS